MHEDEGLLAALLDAKKVGSLTMAGRVSHLVNRAKIRSVSIHQVHLQLILLVAWAPHDWCAAAARLEWRSTDAPVMELQARTEGADHCVRKRGRDPNYEKPVEDWDRAGWCLPSGMACEHGWQK